jgi:Spy/CpxP family protein refolding chaperone
MKNMAISGMFLIAFILAPTLASGQNMPSGKWWHLPRVVKRLNLSEAQIKQLDQAFRKSRLNLIQLKSDVEREQFELETLVENRALDEDAALGQYKKLEQARVKLGVERFQFFLKIRTIVGYEGFQELMAFKKIREQRQRALRNRELSDIGK